MTKKHKERCPWARNELSIRYHDEEWGVPQHDDRRLFEFLILAKRERYREVFDGYIWSFVGSTIYYAYMQAVGMVNDHLVTCFRHCCRP